MPTLVDGVIAGNKNATLIYSFFNTKIENAEIVVDEKPVPRYSDTSDILEIVTKYKEFFAGISQTDVQQLDNDSKLLLEAIRAAWLKDINLKLKGSSTAANTTSTEEQGCCVQFGQQIVSPLSRFACLLAFLGGVIKYVSDTADSFASVVMPLLGASPSVPIIGVVIGMAAIFTLLAIAVYIAFDFAAIRQKMGFNSVQKNRIDELAEQKDQLRLIQESFPMYRLLHKDDPKINEMSLDLIRQLIALHEKLGAEQKEYLQNLESRTLKVTKFVINGLLSLMYAANGFFICQTGLPLIIAALNYILPTALVISAPMPLVMLGIAVLGALAAFIAFYCIEGQALGNFIANSRLFGYTDVDKVNALYNADMKDSKAQLDVLLAELEQQPLPHHEDDLQRQFSQDSSTTTRPASLFNSDHGNGLAGSLQALACA